MRIAGSPKCASAPRVVCALQYGRKRERRGLGERAPPRQPADRRIRPRDEAALHLYAVRPDRVSADPALQAADVAIPDDPDLAFEDRPPGIFGGRFEGVRGAGSRPAIGREPAYPLGPRFAGPRQGLARDSAPSIPLLSAPLQQLAGGWVGGSAPRTPWPRSRRRSVAFPQDTWSGAIPRGGGTRLKREPSVERTSPTTQHVPANCRATEKTGPLPANTAGPVQSHHTLLSASTTSP